MKLLTLLLLSIASHAALSQEAAPEEENTKRQLVHTVDIAFMGCFKDAEDPRSMDHYIDRDLSLEDCAEACQSYGYRYFGRQAKNECWCGRSCVVSSLTGAARYGPAEGCNCDEDAKNHGSWKQCVYDIGFNARPLGCYYDKPERTLPAYKGRKVEFHKCAAECQHEGYQFFGQQSWEECWCGNDRYDKYGMAVDCDCDYKNVGSWKQCVYMVEDYMGCYEDQAVRALPRLMGEGLSKHECLMKCKKEGYHFMGRQSRQQCWCGGRDSHDTGYEMYGRRNDCLCNSRYNIGGWRNCVYQIFHG